MGNLFSNPKKRYTSLLLIILPLIIIAGLLAYLSFKSLKDSFGPSGGPVKPSNLIEEYGYQLRDNATDLQKELFDELKDDIKNKEEVGDLKIAEDVVKNYVADFYTWTNKQGQFDVGGMCYIHGWYKANNWMQAKDGFYTYLSKYMNDYGVEDLLEVESIEVVDSYKNPSKYKIGDSDEDESYHIEAKWTYKPTVKFNTSNYATKLHFTVAKNQYNQFYIVEAYEE